MRGLVYNRPPGCYLERPSPHFHVQNHRYSLLDIFGAANRMLFRSASLSEDCFETAYILVLWNRESCYMYHRIESCHLRE